GANPTGNGRSDSYISEVLPRMTNLIINKGDWNFEEAISDMKNGYYATGFMGGVHNPLFDNYSLSPQLCFKIINGRIESVLKNVYIIGDIKNTLKDIEAIGNKQETIASMCGKSGQIVMAGLVSPFLKVSSMSVLCN
ncbi:MAG TPA: metallopeptidase TldD-related protein, partial [Candidatus Methanoperedens sp.]